MTQAEIQALIDVIQTDSNYTANQMRYLLTQMLEFGTFWTSSVAGDTPTTTDDETAGYKAGSVGYNSNNSRAFICSDATEDAAVWTLLTDDKGLQVLTMTNGATVQALDTSARINLTGSVTTYTLKLPANPYTGKTVVIFVDASGTVGTLTIKDAAGATIGAGSAAAFDTSTYTFNGTTWILTGFAGTIV
jgi:hypothetical protein